MKALFCEADLRQAGKLLSNVIQNSTRTLVEQRHGNAKATFDNAPRWQRRRSAKASQGSARANGSCDCGGEGRSACGA